MASFEINPVTNPRKDRSYWAILSTEESLPCRSADCGVDGHASIYLRYQPTEQCIETRSFGRYLSHLLREAELDQELLHIIAKEVLSSCHPAMVSVEAHFESPEGMSLYLSVTHPESHS
jgi:NADPH-dependent 7-cyano-7-deazaguanine reductase QueF